MTLGSGGLGPAGGMRVERGCIFSRLARLVVRLFSRGFCVEGSASFHRVSVFAGHFGIKTVFSRGS